MKLKRAERFSFSYFNCISRGYQHLYILYNLLIIN